MSDWISVKNGVVEIGDIIRSTDSWGGTHQFKISRVTKTLSMSIREEDGFEYRFKRRIQRDMSHPHTTWNTTHYTVFREPPKEANHD